MKKTLAMMLAGLMLFFGVFSGIPVYADDGATVITFPDSEKPKEEPAPAAASSKPYLAVGADLSQEQLQTVLSLMGISGSDFTQYNIVYITNAEEHQYLDSYISPSVIGTKSLSSVLVKPAEKGHGITVTAKNINYCSEGMYRNALLTAGIEDADIIVAGPAPISGTAALIGAMKAYADMTNTQVNEQALDASLNELVTTGELEEALDNVSKEEVESMIAFVKAEIAGKELNTKSEIEDAVRQAIKDYGQVELSEEEIKRIIELMVKIKELGLDYNTLLDQASDLYEKFGDKLTAGDMDLAELAKEGVKSTVREAVTKAVSGILDGVKSFFNGLFGGKK